MDRSRFAVRALSSAARVRLSSEPIRTRLRSAAALLARALGWSQTEEPR